MTSNERSTPQTSNLRVGRSNLSERAKSPVTPKHCARLDERCRCAFADVRRMSASPWRMMKFRIGQLLLVALGFVVFVYLVLALAEVGGVARCRWGCPRWFGCVLYVHETLAAGLIGAAGALIAAWIAWTALQH